MTGPTVMDDEIGEVIPITSNTDESNESRDPVLKMAVAELPMIAIAMKAGFLPPKQACQYFIKCNTPEGVIGRMKKGVFINGERIKLQCVREGKYWFTRPEWIEEFNKACAENHK